MVKLNLLPAKVREAELLRLVVILGVGVYLGVVALLAWRYVIMVRERSAVDVKIAKVAQDLAPLTAIAEDVRKLTEQKTDQDNKVSKLKELTKRQAYLVRMLDALPDFMQGGQVWLTKLDQTAEKNDRRIILDGVASSVEAWADFYNNLESQSLVSDLKIENSPVFTPKLDRKRNVFSFKVTFLMKEPE